MADDAFDRATLIWLATNLLRGTPDDTLRGELAQRGLAREVIDAAMASLRASVLFEAALPFVEDARRLQMLSRRADALLRSVPTARGVNRIRAEAIDELFGWHLAEGVPLVLEGAARSWPAFERWTWEGLRARYGEVSLQVARKTRNDATSMRPGYAPEVTLRFAELVDHALGGPSEGQPDCLYLVADNRALRGPLSGLVADIAADPRRVRPESIATESFLWLGPAGTRTEMHHDITHVLAFQIRGRKRFRLVPPTDATMMDHAMHTMSELGFDDPRIDEAFVRETVLEAGDALFIPLGYWHAVEALDPAITVSLTGIAGARTPRFRLDGQA